ncbi:hypothetical protein [uncultured Oscillibacter sp.]|uniref:hypothetical protein n=1 Tax=uncultured Oscillibacter sp. TaxID=876091 RepID=UPI0028044508|nr:hypothetical protein [uncultured Oscillibacter sp.]
MKQYKKIDLVWNWFHLLRVTSLAWLILIVALTWAALPLWCVEMRPIHLVPVLLFSAGLLGSFMLWMFCKHRDPCLLAEPSKRYSSYHFLCDPHFCTQCGTRRVLVFAEDFSQIVLPNTTLTKPVSYYCPHCRNTALPKNCTLGKKNIYRTSFFALKQQQRVAQDVLSRPARRAIQIHITLSAIFILLCLLSAVLVRIHLVFVVLWWVSLYLLTLSLYHIGNRLSCAYLISDVGILQRSLGGCHLMHWENINLVAEIATKNSIEPITVLYTQFGNHVLSPALTHYEEFRFQLEKYCKENRIPYQR